MPVRSCQPLEHIPTRAFQRERTIQGLSLRANFAWTLGGNIVLAASQWAVLIILAHSVPPEQVGRYAYAFAVTSPVLMCSNLALRALLATDARATASFGEYFGLRVISSSVAVAFIAIVGCISDHPRIILIVGIGKAIEAISDVFFGLLQQHDRMDVIAKSMIVRGLATSAGLALAMRSQSVVKVATIVALGTVMVLACYTIPRTSRIFKKDKALSKVLSLRPEFALPALLRLAGLGLPLGVGATLGSLSINIPRYFLEHYSGDRSLGIFSAITYIVVSGNLVVNALAEACAPRLARHWAGAAYGDYRRVLGLLFATACTLGTGGIVAAIVFGRPLLTALYGAEYAARQDILVLGMIAAALGFLIACGGTGLTANRSLRVQPLIHIARIGTVTLFSALLIPRLGGLGAAWTAIAGAAVQLALTLIFLRRAESTRAGRVKQCER